MSTEPTASPNVNGIHGDSLKPLPIVKLPHPKYDLPTRKFQGIPGLERSAKGRLFAVWYANDENKYGNTEGPGNYVPFSISDDDGATWIEKFVIAPEGCHEMLRAFDPCLWFDPQNRLWLFWAQSYSWYNGRAGIWGMYCEDADTASDFVWSTPVRIGNGVMMNKPTVLSDGTWALPTAVWSYQGATKLPELVDEQNSGMTISRDNGKTFQRVGGVKVPHVSFDEHMIVERKDGTLWMVARTNYGYGQSTSADGGKTWSMAVPLAQAGPSSRFFLRRLKSGSLLMVFNNHNEKRLFMTAMISEDDGLTWKGNLILDERDCVSYPDGVQTEDGTIYITYDRERTKAMDILMSVFTEEDILAGEFKSPGSRTKQIITTRA